MECKVCGRKRREGNTDRFWERHVLKCLSLLYNCPGCKMTGNSKVMPQDKHFALCPMLRQCPHCSEYIALDEKCADKNQPTEHEQTCKEEIKCEDCHKFFTRGVLRTRHSSECPQKFEKCNECRQVFRRFALPAHQQNECPENVVSYCGLCRENIRRKDSPHTLCPEEIIMCPYECGVRDLRRLVRNHERWCEDAPVKPTCECASIDPHVRIKRKLIAKHLCWKYQIEVLHKTVANLSQQLHSLQHQFNQLSTPTAATTTTTNATNVPNAADEKQPTTKTLYL